MLTFSRNLANAETGVSDDDEKLVGYESQGLSRAENAELAIFFKIKI